MQTIIIIWECSIWIPPYGVTVFLPRGSLWQAYPSIGGLPLVFPLNSGSWIMLPPKGRYLGTPEMRSITSYIVGPWAGISCSGPLRATLPSEVVTISK